jgi:hypothetical protein
VIDLFRPGAQLDFGQSPQLAQSAQRRGDWQSLQMLRAVGEFLVTHD